MVNQDERIKVLCDAIANRHGYTQGVLDSEKGTITYETYRNTPAVASEVLRSVRFRNDLYDTLIGEDGGFNISSHFGEVVVTLPDWEQKE